MGKVAYMAPEQARGEDVDGRSDLFAVGVIAFELLTGQRYYEGMTPHQIWASAGSGEHSATVLQSVSPEMMGILAHALAPDRERRYPTCGDFREALETYMYNRGIRAGDGRREMRALMDDLYRGEREAERQLLAQLQSSKPLPAAPVSTEDSRSFVAVTEGGTITSDSGPPLTAGEQTETQVASSPGNVRLISPGPDTEPTEAHVLAAGLTSKKAAPIAAGVLAFLVVGGGLAAVLLGGGDEAADKPAPTAPAATADAGAAAATDPASDAQGAKDAGPAAPAAVADAGAEPPPTVKPDKPAAKPKPRVRKRRRSRRTAKPAGKPAPPRRWKDLKVYLRKYCKDVACTAPALKKANAAKDNPPIDELRALTAELRRCAKTCYGR
jgi:hypothetical protein